MRRIKLIVGTHNSQPVGAGELQIEDAYQSSYKPFLTTLYSHPEIEAVLHYSGILLAWFEERHPEFLMLLNEMVKRKQVELLGGGYYEPVLPLIPSPDRLGQIEMLTTALRRYFGRRPRGGWVAERIWEPGLASTIKNSGIDYTFLDDNHFRTAGFEGADLYRACITEDQGKVLVVYPISVQLSSMVPASTPEEAVELILSQASEDGDRLAVFLNDGERYGLWEKRGKKIFKDGWFDRFFALIAEEKQRIEVLSPSRHQRNFIPIKKGYFRSTTYDEMMSWTQDHSFYRDPELQKTRRSSQRSGSSGGNFRQFLARYPESNILYSKIISTHVLVNQIRGDRHRKKTAREELWKGECNSALWHGKDGGIYDNRLRKATYRALIEAEKVTREKGIFRPSLACEDFDMDGESEYLYRGQELNSYVDVVGGTLFELEYVPVAWNYLDTLARHREPYHQDGMGLPFDWYPRRGFVDHVLLPNESINAFDRMSYAELGGLIESAYSVEAFERERNELKLRAATAFSLKSRSHSIELSKNYTFRKSALVVHYGIENTSEEPFRVNFGSEVNLALESNTRDRVELSLLNGEKRSPLSLEKTSVEDTGELVVADRRNKVAISLAATRNFKLWSMPVETTSRTLTGTSRCYQSSCFLPQWTVQLEPKGIWEVSLTLSFSRL